jgi:hypothetical protein
MSGHFMSTYEQANSYQLAVFSSRVIETGSPADVENASPERAAVTSCDRKLSASALVLNPCLKRGPRLASLEE